MGGLVEGRDINISLFLKMANAHRKRNIMAKVTNGVSLTEEVDMRKRVVQAF